MKITSSYAASVAVCLSCVLAIAPCVEANVPMMPQQLSRTVVQAAVTKAVLLINKSLSSQATAADYAAAQTAVATLFGHLQETGNNAVIQNQALTNQQQFVSYGGLTESQIAAQQTYLAASGSKLPANQYAIEIGGGPIQVQQAFAALQSQGLWNLQQQTVAHLEAAQITKTKQSQIGYAINITGGAQLKRMALQLNGKAHLQRVSANFCSFMAMIFAIAAVFCPALAIIAAIYAFMDTAGLCD